MVNVTSFSVDLKIGLPIGDYRLPVFTGRAEPQEGGGIDRAWIEKIRRYTPVYEFPNHCDECLTGHWWLQETVLLKCMSLCC